MFSGPPLDLLSIGKMSEVLQRPPHEIQDALAARNIPPVFRLNDIAYFPRRAMEVLRGDGWPPVEGRADE